MAVPEFQTFMVPVLTSLSDGQIRHWQDLDAPVSATLRLSPDDLAETISSGKKRSANRLEWAITHLAQAGLLNRPRRGHVEITERGREVLAKNPSRIDADILSQFTEYQDFRSRTGTRSTRSNGSTPASTSTPLEAIADAVRETHAALADEVLQRVYDQEPIFLERLVLKLLTAMGYGGRAGATEHWGKSGDGGIDGVVKQDVLGLDRVYVQAKRYARERTVGRPDIQAFVGALHGQQAERGVFITTSGFSAEARDYVDRIPNRIVLIDGRRLAELMILHNVGVQDEDTFVLKRLDEDFFDQP